MTALGLAAVGIGAVFGAWLRWTFGIWLNPLWPEVPMGTLVANLVGGCIIGMAIEFFAAYPGLAPEWRLALITGFLGALTTFSTYSAESVTLLLRGQYAWALGHAALHLGGSIVMTIVGMAMFRWLAR
ncbi:MAG TPA: fluoride efflux transporter CrcB [Burkholderiaceae bacterium]|nr:fluoride efflux transporter CrcB [Burkholderiaceae bacterium]